MLAEKEKPCRQSVAQAVRDDMEKIEKARGKGFSWAEISEALGFLDKWEKSSWRTPGSAAGRKKKKELDTLFGGTLGKQSVCGKQPALEKSRAS